MSLELFRQVKELLKGQEIGARSRSRSMTGVRVLVCEDPGPCPLCGGPMKVQKTHRRPRVSTLEFGTVCLVETVHECVRRCRYPSGAFVTRRPRGVRELLLPASTVGYDVMIWAGLQRFLCHRQREEIRADLQELYGVKLSSGEVGELTRRFLRYLEALHDEQTPILRAAMKAEGGYVLQVDATGEDGRGTILVAMAGWRRWVLDAWKVSSEREDLILAHLRSLVKRFGAPCAVMRDLGRGMIPAVKALVAELGGLIVILSCHLHFLRDVGKGLLNVAYGELRDLLRTHKIHPHLCALARDLGRSFDQSDSAWRQQILTWLLSKPRSLPSGERGVTVVRVLTQSVLDYAADNDNLRYPFDRPYLDLYRRGCTVRRAVDDLFRRPDLDAVGRRALGRLARALDPLVSEKSFSRVAEKVEKRARLFDRLREVLRVDPTNSDPLPTATGEDPSSAESACKELDQMRERLEALRRQLQDERPERGPADDLRDAIDLIEEHLKRYGDTLWGHAITVIEEDGTTRTRLAPRTNNDLESRFGFVKQGLRRTSGKKSLASELERLPASVMLVSNLQDPDYVQLVCGSLEGLPRAFARLDEDRLAARLRGEPRQAINESLPTPVASPSLPKEDRCVVRSELLHAYIAAAAKSRAPRVATARG